MIAVHLWCRMKNWKLIVVLAVLFVGAVVSFADENWTRFTRLVPHLVKNEMVVNPTLKKIGIKEIYKGGNGFVVTFKGDEAKIKKAFAEYLYPKGISYDRIRSRLSWDIYCPS